MITSIWDFIVTTLNAMWDGLSYPMKRYVPREWWPIIIVVELFLILGLYLFSHN